MHHSIKPPPPPPLHTAHHPRMRDFAHKPPRRCDMQRARKGVGKGGSIERSGHITSRIFGTSCLAVTAACACVFRLVTANQARGHTCAAANRAYLKRVLGGSTRSYLNSHHATFLRRSRACISPLSRPPLLPHTRPPHGDQCINGGPLSGVKARPLVAA